MDADRALAEQRQLIAEIKTLNEGNFDSCNTHAIAECAVRLAEVSEALDQWISNGGFAPKAWRDEW